jgi:hypothetical protein
VYEDGCTSDSSLLFWSSLIEVVSCDVSCSAALVISRARNTVMVDALVSVGLGVCEVGFIDI